jgi:hypothetical protein
MAKCSVERDDLPEDVVTREKIIRHFHQPESAFKVIIANPFASQNLSPYTGLVTMRFTSKERSTQRTSFSRRTEFIELGFPEGTITHYHYLVSERSIDETIHNRLIEKEARMTELIENSEIPLITQNVNFDVDLEDDIKAIIRDYVRRVS